MGFQHATNRQDQLLDQGHQSGIQQGRQGAAGCIQRIGQFMGTGDGQGGFSPNQITNGDFVAGVSCAEIATDRNGRNLLGQGFDLGAGGIQVQCLPFPTIRVVSPSQEQDRIGSHCLAQSCAVQGFFILSDQDQSDRKAMLFDNCIGRQRGRQRNQPDFRRVKFW